VAASGGGQALPPNRFAKSSQSSSNSARSVPRLSSCLPTLPRPQHPASCINCGISLWKNKTASSRRGFQFRTALFSSRPPNWPPRFLAPKISALLALHELFLAKEMDFLALVSSVSAVFPPAGASRLTLRLTLSSIPSLSLFATAVFSTNWGLWQNVGMGRHSNRAPAA